MATDFGYNGKIINSNGGFKPSGKNTPIDARTRVNTFADIASIPSMKVLLNYTIRSKQVIKLLGRKLV